MKLVIPYRPSLIYDNECKLCRRHLSMAPRKRPTRTEPFPPGCLTGRSASKELFFSSQSENHNLRVRPFDINLNRDHRKCGEWRQRNQRRMRRESPPLSPIVITMERDRSEPIERDGSRKGIRFGEGGAMNFQRILQQVRTMIPR